MMNILKFLVDQGFTVGFAEGRRLIRSKQIKVEGVLIEDTSFDFPTDKSNVSFSVGRKKFTFNQS